MNVPKPKISSRSALPWLDHLQHPSDSFEPLAVVDCRNLWIGPDSYYLRRRVASLAERWIDAVIASQPRLVHLGEDVPPLDVVGVSSKLTELIVRHGAENRRVAVLLENPVSFVATVLSAIQLEYSAVLLNPTFRPREVERAVGLARATLLVAPEEYRVSDALKGTHAQALGRVDTHWGGRLVLWRIAEEMPLSPADEPAAEREFVVQFTSGVSGEPMGVCRTYAEADNELDAFQARAQITSDDVVLCAVPLFHSYGFFPGLMASLRAGAKFVAMPKFSPVELSAVIKRHRPTIMLGVPLMYEVLSLAQDDAMLNFSNLRLLISAGGPLPSNVSSAFHNKFGKRISQLYGSTETGVIAFDGRNDGSGASDSVGAPLSGRQIRIVDDQGRDVVAGDDGEIILKSAATAKAYLGSSEIVSAKIKNGWYFTSDVGHFDAQGRLHLAGRKSAFINVAGLKVDPTEVEQVILSSGEVAECAVIGITRPQFGEAIHAYLVLKPGGDIDRIRAHCRSRISSFKMPREFRSVDRLPRSAIGKVLRNDLKA